MRLQTHIWRRAASATGVVLLCLAAPCGAGARYRNGLVARCQGGPSTASARLISASASAAPASSLLLRMLDAEDKLTLSGTQVTVITRNGLDVTSTQRYIRRGSQYIRIEWLRPPRMQGEVIIDNGRYWRRYSPASNTEMVDLSHLAQQQRLGKRLRDRAQSGKLDVQWQGQEMIAGRPCDIIRVATGGNAFVRLWVDTATGAQLKNQHYRNKDDLRSTSYFTDVTINPPLARRDLMPPRMPDKTKLITLHDHNPLGNIADVQKQTGYPILQPAYLPAGFRFESGYVWRYQDRNVAKLNFGNGLTVISLFETPSPRPPEHPGIRHHHEAISESWSSGINLILIGNVDQGEREKILASVH